MLKAMASSEKDRLADEIAARWEGFQDALLDKRRYPTQQFRSFAETVRRYVQVTRGDALIHRTVAKTVNGLLEYVGAERKRVPGDILWEAERLECLFFSGYDPHFEGDEPPGL